MVTFLYGTLYNRDFVSLACLSLRSLCTAHHGCPDGKPMYDPTHTKHKCTCTHTYFHTYFPPFLQGLRKPCMPLPEEPLLCTPRLPDGKAMYDQTHACTHKHTHAHMFLLLLPGLCEPCMPLPEDPLQCTLWLPRWEAHA